MPTPLHFLRDAADHWLSNPVPIPGGGSYIIAGQPDLFRLVYVPMATRRGVTLLPPTPANRDDGEPLPVQVNANRWIVQCPDCGGAEYAWPDHFWFLCGSCFNASTGGKWRPVLWPGDADIDAVEDVLLARTVPFARNWNPDAEALADLQEQNRERGDPESSGFERPGPRLKASRPAREKSGAAWREKVQKRPRQTQASLLLPLPRGWSPVPLAVAEPDPESVGEGILYPEVPIPPPLPQVPYIPSGESSEL